jgi:hypothetical protein
MRTHASPEPLGPPDPFTPLDVRPDDLHSSRTLRRSRPGRRKVGPPDRRAALPTSDPLVTARPTNVPFARTDVLRVELPGTDRADAPVAGTRVVSAPFA